MEVLVNLGIFSIYTINVFIILAFFWVSFIFFKKGQEYHREEADLFDGILVMGVLSLIGARVAYVLTNLSEFSGHLPRTLLLSEYPGLSVWGVVTGIVIGSLLMVYKRGVKLFDWLDLVALSLPSGVAIVSLGVIASGKLSPTIVYGIDWYLLEAFY